MNDTSAKSASDSTEQSRETNEPYLLAYADTAAATFTAAPRSRARRYATLSGVDDIGSHTLLRVYMEGLLADGKTPTYAKLLLSRGEARRLADALQAVLARGE